MYPTEQPSTATQEFDDRRSYDMPQLQHYGDLSTLTQNGGATIGDLELGSVMDDGR